MPLLQTALAPARANAGSTRRVPAFRRVIDLLQH
jgi:hypothetical protein